MTEICDNRSHVAQGNYKYDLLQTGSEFQLLNFYKNVMKMY